MAYYRVGKGGKRYWGKRGAGILFTNGTQVLLLRRAGNGGAADHVGKWCMPGGGTESGETALDTAKRECREEIGTVQGERFAQFDERDGQHQFTVFIYKVGGPFDVKLSKEHDQHKWVDLTEVKRLPLHPEFEKNLSHYLRAIQKKFPSNFGEWVETNKGG